MGLLTPLFLAGLAALAIPVLIHLVQRQNLEGQTFPSLMFLRQISYREKRRREIRHWWLLLLRCLGILLLVLAFARPFLTGLETAAAVTDDRRDLVILIDRSYSMAYAERWQQAQQAALNALDGLAPNDRTSVILFDHHAQAIGELSPDHSLARSAINDYQPGPGTTNYRAALDQAGRLLAQSEAKQREVLLLSDFQSNGYDPKDNLQLPAGVKLITAAELITATTANVTLASLDLLSKLSSNNQEIIELSARISNTGDQPVNDLDIILELDGYEVEKRVLNLASGAMESVVFDIAPATDTPVQGIVRLPADGLTQDNAFYFVLLPAAKLPVLVLENFGARPRQSLFLQRALELSEDPGFQIEIKMLEELQGTDIDDKAIVVINDAPIPGGETGERLRDFVEAGGGLFVVAADRLQGGWPGGESGYLPGNLGRQVERIQARGASINQLDFSHPVLELFNTPRSGKLSATQVFQYRQLEPNDNDRILAHYDDGAVALAERQVGAGRVIVLTTTLDNHWNTLALQPVFVPLMYRLMSYLAAYQAVPSWFTVGGIVDISRHAQTLLSTEFITPDEDLIVEAPSGEQHRLSGANKLLTLTEAGFYEVHRTAAETSEIIIASNIDTRESQFAALDVEAFVAQINAADPSVVSAAANNVMTATTEPTPREQEQNQRLWWYLLLSALLILAVETLLSNRLSSKPQQA